MNELDKFLVNLPWPGRDWHWELQFYEEAIYDWDRDCHVKTKHIKLMLCPDKEGFVEQTGTQLSRFSIKWCQDRAPILLKNRAERLLIEALEKANEQDRGLIVE